MEVQLPAKSSWNDRLFVWERAVLCELFTLKIKCVATLQWSVYWTSVDHMLLILCEITINEAKNDQRVPRMICGKSKFSSARFYFSFLAYHSHKNPRVEILWWENAPLQSISKWTKQSKKNTKVAKPQNRPHKFWSLSKQNGAEPLRFRLEFLLFPCQRLGTHEHVPR